MAIAQLRESRTSQTSIFYRFQVVDPRTGEPYVITLSDEGLPVVGEAASTQYDQCLTVAWEDSEERPRWIESIPA